MAAQRDVDLLFDEIFGLFGRLDHAVNCAGIDPEIVPDPEWDFDVYQKVIAVNVNSVFLCMRREIQHMREVAAGTTLAGLVDRLRRE